VFEAIQQWDLTILHWIRAFNAPFFVAAASVFAGLAWKGWAWWLIAAGSWLRNRAFSLHLTLSLLVSIVFGLSIKGFIHRERPDTYAANIAGLPMPAPQELMSTVHSFPSGHALLAAAFAMTLFYYRKDYRTWIAFALVLVIGAARVHQGVHWPSDVAGAAVLGALCAVVAGWLCKLPVAQKLINSQFMSFAKKAPVKPAVAQPEKELVLK
jgi:membrane-associated phospholipid phosphatase